MDEQQIKAKMAEASQRFDELKAQADEIEGELKRLQGEYRAFESLLTPDPATTITAKPAKAAK